MSMLSAANKLSRKKPATTGGVVPVPNRAFFMSRHGQDLSACFLPPEDPTSSFDALKLLEKNQDGLKGVSEDFGTLTVDRNNTMFDQGENSNGEQTLPLASSNNSNIAFGSARHPGAPALSGPTMLEGNKSRASSDPPHTNSHSPQESQTMNHQRERKATAGDGTQRKHKEKKPSVDVKQRIVRTAYGPALLLSPNLPASVNTQTLSHVASQRKFRHWTEEEDEILKRAMKNEKGPPYNWKKISVKYFLGTRKEHQIKGRWKKAHCPGISRAPFTPEEDQVILEAQKRGESWQVIASLLQDRTAAQVRDRFVMKLDPTLLKKIPFSEKEAAMVHEARERMGNKWRKIAELLPGRNESMVKNYYYGLKHRERRAMRRRVQLKEQVADLVKARDHKSPPEATSKEPESELQPTSTTVADTFSTHEPKSDSTQSPQDLPDLSDIAHMEV